MLSFAINPTCNQAEENRFEIPFLSVAANEANNQAAPLQLCKITAGKFHNSNVASLTISSVSPATDQTTQFTEEQINAINISPKLLPEQMQKLRKFLRRQRHCFAYSIKELKKTTMAELKLELIDNAPIVNVRNFRRGPAEEAIMKAKVQELQKANLIEECSSPYNSPAFLQPKGNPKSPADYRFLQDMRKINEICKKVSATLPDIDVIINDLAGHKYVTVLDLSNGYYCLPISKDN